MMKNSGKKETSMTAKVSAFARAWHREHSPRPVFDDPLAKVLLGEDFLQIAGQMAAGIGFFAPDFSGTEEEALTHIVNTQLGPLPLARAAFGEQTLEQAAACGAGQYLILGAGYDSFALRQPEWARNMTVYELDLPDTAADKQERLQRAGLSVPDNVRYVQADLTAPDWTQRLKQAGFAPGVPTFCALPGVSYYLPHGALKELLLDLGGLLPAKSLLALDYPTEDHGRLARTQTALAAGAGEPMVPGYAPTELEGLLEAGGFRLNRLLDETGIAETLFSAHDRASPAQPMRPVPGAALCLAEKTGD